METVKQTNLNFLFQDQIVNFAHLITVEPQTKEQFAENVKKTYSLENMKVNFFYQSILKSDFETIRLSNTRDSILFNH
jgi:hypothetical protein